MGRLGLLDSVGMGLGSAELASKKSKRRPNTNKGKNTFLAYSITQWQARPDCLT